MAALTQERMRDFERWTYHLFPLASGNKAWKQGIAILSAGKVYPGGHDGIMIGLFDRTVDATSAEKQVQVNFGTEIEVEWLANDGTIAADDIGELAYVIDDQTIGLAGTVIAGRIWWVDAGRGVAVQKLPFAVAP